MGLTGLRSTVLAVDVEERGRRDNGETYWDFSDIIEGYIERLIWKELPSDHAFEIADE